MKNPQAWILSLEVSDAAKNFLVSNDIHLVEELLFVTSEAVSRMPNYRRGFVEEIDRALRKRGFENGIGSRIVDIARGNGAHQSAAGSPASDHVCIVVRPISKSALLAPFITFKHSIDATEAWMRQRSGMLWIVAACICAYVYWDSTASQREAKRQADEKESVGMLATVAGSMMASAARSCQKVGMPNIPNCASNTGTLVYDFAAKEWAKLALQQKISFDTTCAKYYSEQYCSDLLNRALQISWANGDQNR